MQLRCTKLLFNGFLLLISVCLQADYFYDIFHIYLRETLALLLFHTYFSLLPLDTILGHNFCSLKETDQKLRLEGHIVVLILIFLLIISFRFHILCAVFIPLFNFHSNCCVAVLVTLKTAYATRIPNNHGLC